MISRNYLRCKRLWYARGLEYRMFGPRLTVAQPSKKTQMQKTAHDFQLSFVAFQRAQQLSAEKQRTVVKSVKLAVEEDSET
jgi:hypothetical protein